MVAVVIHSPVRAYAEAACRFNCIYVRAEEQEFPAVFRLLPLYHLLHGFAVVTAAGVLHSVRSYHEQSMLRHVLFPRILMYVAYVRSFLQVYVDYYEYKNPLIIGNEVLFTDYFGKGGFDPFVDGYEDDSMMEENAAMDDTTEITDDSEDERIDDENIFSQQDNESDTAIDADNDGYPLTEEFQPYKKELTAVATYIKDNELYHDVKAGNEFSEFLVYNISAKGHPYVNIAEQVYEQDGISIIATHYIIINESYVENGSREYVYQIKFEDESGNEVASRKVVDFYLIDTETLVITDEKTNDWH